MEPIYSLGTGILITYIGIVCCLIRIHRNRTPLPTRTKILELIDILNDSVITINPLVEEEECPICINKLDSKIVRLTCGHTYHYHCIYEWFRKSATCPLCRTSF